MVCISTAPCTAMQGLKRRVVQTVGSIHSQVEGILRRADLSAEPAAEQKLPEQLQALFSSIDSLRQECEAVSGPPELPELSDSIEHIKVRGTPLTCLSWVCVVQTSTVLDSSCVGGGMCTSCYGRT